MRIQQERRSLGGFANRRRIDSRAREALLMGASLLPVIFLWGCAGIVSGKNTQPLNTQPPQTYLISGTISPIAGGSGATVTLSGAASATTTADASGNFTFTALANGTYTLTPSHPGYAFSPTSLGVTVNGANVTTGVSFTATAQTYSISGTISPTAGGSGATVALSGAASATTTANGSGAYIFTGLTNGAYTVTPSHTGYTFSPVSQNATVNGADVTGINFTATVQTAPTYSISGTIRVRQRAGEWSDGNLEWGKRVLRQRPTARELSHFPGCRTGPILSRRATRAIRSAQSAKTQQWAARTSQEWNFTATAQTAPTYTISGTISPAAGGDLATVTLSGAANTTTIANATGSYTFTGLADGAYTVTPSNSGYTFSPANQAVSVNGANVVGVNFTATVAQSHSVALTWTASTSSVSGYNVYRGTANGGPYALVNISLVAGLSFTDSTVQNGLTYYYVTTAVDASGDESAYSTPAQANVP